MTENQPVSEPVMVLVDSRSCFTSIHTVNHLRKNWKKKNILYRFTVKSKKFSLTILFDSKSFQILKRKYFKNSKEVQVQYLKKLNVNTVTIRY